VNLVVITASNIETALPVTKRARERNKKAAIVVRCRMDEFTEIPESLGPNEVISSSKSAFNKIATHIGALGAAR
jgi:Trk K+ transport system NAD-binding subunit